jgi:hypothetical protein
LDKKAKKSTTVTENEKTPKNLKKPDSRKKNV